MRYIFLLLLILSVNSYSQKITIENDKFLKVKRIETGWSQLRPTLYAPLALKIRSVGEHIYITLAGANVGANVIGNTASVMFLLDNDSTVLIISTGIQDYDIGEYGKSYRHQYEISKEDLIKLSDHLVTSVRKSDSETYHDFDVEEKNSKKFRELVIRFLKEIDKP